MNRSTSDHDDVNDIMSLIMSNATTQPVLQPEPASTLSRVATEQALPTTSQLPFVAYAEELPHNPPKKKNRAWYYALLILLLLSVFTAVGFYSRTYLSALLGPPSPFKGKIGDQTFPLFYPTELPGTYKIELGSIASTNGVVSFSMSNDRAQRVLFKLQEVPQGLNLAAFEEQYIDFKLIAAEATTVKVGVSTDNNETAHMVAGSTWITITSSKDTLAKEDYDLLLNSLRADKIN
jgi:hypothetical protein